MSDEIGEPGAGAAGASAPAGSAPDGDEPQHPAAPERRRRRWWRPVIGVLVAVGLLAGAGELAIRLAVPGIIASAVRQKLALGATHPVDVELGGVAVVPALTGRLGDLTIAVDDAELFDGLTGTVELHADSVPFDFQHGEIRGAVGTLTLNRSQLSPAIHLLTSGVADGGKVDDGQLVVSKEVSLFGVDVPVKANLGLAVRDGDVVIKPRGIDAVGFDLSAKRLRKLTGHSLDGILKSHDVCVRDRLPAGLELTGIDLLASGSARLTVAVSPRILSDPAELEAGEC